jgi:putative transposase
MLIAALIHLCAKGDNLDVGGLDFGITNAMGMAFANGQKGAILSGYRLTSKMEYQSKKLDRWKEKNVPAELTALLSKRDKLPAGQSLPREEKKRIKDLCKEMYSHPAYIKLLNATESWRDDAFKKTAAGTIKIAKKCGIQVLVVGLNKNWKTESNMGGEQNRRFHALAHSRILSQLRSTGEKHGILVVSTEESYTSQISFCNNVELRKYEEKEEVKTQEGCTEQENATRTGLSPSGNTKKENGGQRGTKNRHVYQNEGTRKGKPANWRKIIHAEINGAYNMMRKLFEWFSFNSKLSLDYDLYWLSPKCGVTPMKTF